MEYFNYDDGEIKIRASVKDDVSQLKDNLRTADLLEMKLMGTESVEQTLMYGLEAPKSICYTVEFHGKIVAMFGCVPIEYENVATIWMLSSEDVQRFKSKFLKLAKQYVARFKEEHKTLFNLIHPTNKLSMKLVTLLKAELRPGFFSPKTKEPFILFLI